MVTMRALDPRKSVVKVAAIQVAIDDVAKIGPKKTVPPCKGLVIGLLEGLKMILHALIIGRVVGKKMAHLAR